MIMNFCTVLNNNRFALCSAHWQQASKFSALRHFELIWKDCDQYAHQNNNDNNNNNNNNNNELKKNECDDLLSQKDTKVSVWSS